MFGSENELVVVFKLVRLSLLAVFTLLSLSSLVEYFTNSQ